MYVIFWYFRHWIPPDPLKIKRSFCELRHLKIIWRFTWKYPSPPLRIPLDTSTSGIPKDTSKGPQIPPGMALTTLMHSSGIREFACLSVLAICCRKVFCSILSHSLIVARVPPQATGRDWLSWMPQPGGLGLLGTLNSPWIPWMREIQKTQTQIQIHNYIVCMYIILDATTKRVRPTVCVAKDKTCM